jgi:hypothetical protein
VDGTGNAYVTGYTSSPTDFPTVNAFQSTNGGAFDAFITKINPSGSAKLYSTYLGGSANDVGNGIAVDSAGNAYVAGYTFSSNFPTFNPLQPSKGSGSSVAFVTKVNPSGSAKVYSTYLGGTGNDQGNAIAVDSTGNAYVTGYTGSTDFPVTANVVQTSYAGNNDAFVTKINAAGSAISYSTFLGGTGADIGTAIAVDEGGNAYVVGYTVSIDFPVASPVQTSNGGGSDAFVTKLNATGTIKVYSTYFGGSSTERAQGIAVDSGGNAYVAGVTLSANFPTLLPFQATNANAGNTDAFVFSIFGNAPTAAFRDVNGAIELLSSLSTTPKNSGGVFSSDPGVAQDRFGNTFVVARDNFNALWVNTFSSQSETWGSWAFAGGAVQGVPSIATIGSGTSYFVARDNYNAYWINSYTPGSGFGSWTNLGGVFSTDPVIAVNSSCTSVCSLYLVGKDNFNAIWTGIYTVPGGFGGWQFQGAVVGGKPSVTVGVDGAAYIGVRDTYNALWMGRLALSSFTGWQPGSGTVATDPKVAGSDGKIYAVALTSAGTPWYNTFTEGTGNNWTGWQSSGGVLTSVTAAASSGPQLFLVGQDQSNQLWWYETPGAGWRFFGNMGLAAGPLVAAPR